MYLELRNRKLSDCHAATFLHLSSQSLRNPVNGGEGVMEMKMLDRVRAGV